MRGLNICKSTCVRVCACFLNQYIHHVTACRDVRKIHNKVATAKSCKITDVRVCITMCLSSILIMTSRGKCFSVSNVGWGSNRSHVGVRGREMNVAIKRFSFYRRGSFFWLPLDNISELCFKSPTTTPWSRGEDQRPIKQVVKLRQDSLKSHQAVKKRTLKKRMFAL